MDIEPEKFTAKDARLISEKYKESVFLQQHQAMYNDIIAQIKKTANESEETRITLDEDIPLAIVKKLKDAGFKIEWNACKSANPIILW